MNTSSNPAPDSSDPRTHALSQTRKQDPILAVFEQIKREALKDLEVKNSALEKELQDMQDQLLASRQLFAEVLQTEVRKNAGGREKHAKEKGVWMLEKEELSAKLAVYELMLWEHGVEEDGDDLEEARGGC
jgi:hypothetical protein